MADQRAIFITGGGSGIGRATAQLFAQRGWRVGVADINAEGIEATRALLPAGQSSGHVMDVRDRAQWTAALEEFTATTGGRLDVLFNNAGVARGGQFADVPDADNDLLVDVNFRGVMHGAEIGYAFLKRTPGACLLNTCSAAGIYGAPRLAVYAATKFAVRGLSEALDAEWAADGIKVRTIMPSFIDTPLLDVGLAGSNHNAREDVTRAGLELTPVQAVADAAWAAVHGRKLHTVVGKTARQLALFARLSPALLQQRMLKLARAGRDT